MKHVLMLMGIGLFVLSIFQQGDAAKFSWMQGMLFCIGSYVVDINDKVSKQ